MSRPSSDEETGGQCCQICSISPLSKATAMPCTEDAGGRCFAIHCGLRQYSGHCESSCASVTVVAVAVLWNLCQADAPSSAPAAAAASAATAAEEKKRSRSGQVMKVAKLHAFRPLLCVWI